MNIYDQLMLLQYCTSFIHFVNAVAAVYNIYYGNSV